MQLLKHWMEQTGTTPKKLAALAKTSEATISRLLNCKQVPSLHLAKQLAQVTGNAVTPNDWVGIETASQPPKPVEAAE